MIRTIWLVGALLVASCGSSSGGGGGDGDGEDGPPDHSTLTWRPLDGLSSDMNRYLEAFCRRSNRCSNDSFVDCNDWSNGVYCEPGFASAVLPGLDACVKALADDPCEVHYAPECFGARKGLRDARGFYTLAREGEACDSRLVHCDFDLFCTGEGDACGECKRAQGEGAPCEDHTHCQQGKFYCSEERCVPVLQKGEECAAYEDVCAPNLYCNGAVCADIPPLRVQGESCEADGHCYSSFCQDGECVPPSACSAGGPNDPCNNDAGCGEGLVCNVYNTFRCAAEQAIGDPCRAATSLCVAGSYCKRLDGESVCAPLLANGEPCELADSDDGTCASYFCGPEQKCTERVFACE
jgi:hypothetical protein